MKWSDKLPKGCPPDDSELAEGSFFHFIEGDEAQGSDFLSRFEKDSSQGGNCKAHGISLIRNKEDLGKYRKEYETIYADKKVVIVSLTSECGVILDTPSKLAKSHVTWWKPVDVNPCDLCTILDEA